jgi:hypothetical protein
LLGSLIATDRRLRSFGRSTHRAVKRRTTLTDRQIPDFHASDVGSNPAGVASRSAEDHARGYGPPVTVGRELEPLGDELLDELPAEFAFRGERDHD